MSVISSHSNITIQHNHVGADIIRLQKKTIAPDHYSRKQFYPHLILIIARSCGII